MGAAQCAEALDEGGSWHGSLPPALVLASGRLLQRQAWQGGPATLEALNRQPAALLQLRAALRLGSSLLGATEGSAPILLLGGGCTPPVHAQLDVIAAPGPLYQVGGPPVPTTLYACHDLGRRVCGAQHVWSLRRWRRGVAGQCSDRGATCATNVP